MCIEDEEGAIAGLKGTRRSHYLEFNDHSFEELTTIAHGIFGSESQRMAMILLNDMVNVIEGSLYAKIMIKEKDKVLTKLRDTLLDNTETEYIEAAMQEVIKHYQRNLMRGTAGGLLLGNAMIMFDN